MSDTKLKNDRGGERGRCPNCKDYIDSCMYFDKEDYRTLQCPTCKHEVINYAFYPESYQKAKEEYQRSLKK